MPVTVSKYIHLGRVRICYSHRTYAEHAPRKDTSVNRKRLFNAVVYLTCMAIIAGLIVWMLIEASNPPF